MSNQLEQLSKLYAKTKEYKIPRDPKDGEEQATIMITPLSLEKAYLLDAISKEGLSLSELSKGFYALLSESLSVPEEDVKNIDFKYVTEIMDIIGGSNKFNEMDKDKLDKVKSMMARNHKQ